MLDCTCAVGNPDIREKGMRGEQGALVFESRQRKAQECSWLLLKLHPKFKKEARLDSFVGGQYSPQAGTMASKFLHGPKKQLIPDAGEGRQAHKRNSMKVEEAKAQPFTLVLARIQPEAPQTCSPSVSIIPLGEPSQHNLETIRTCAAGFHSHRSDSRRG